jgi:glutaredoxin 3
MEARPEDAGEIEITGGRMQNGAIIVLFAALLGFPAGGFAAETPAAPQSPVHRGESRKTEYPRIGIYTTSWCPHCKATKEYLTRKNIPFINKDVELDERDMETLTGKYKSQGVPVIVIGDDEKVLKGFDPETFEKAVREVGKKNE